LVVLEEDLLQCRVLDAEAVDFIIREDLEKFVDVLLDLEEQSVLVLH